MVVFLATGVCEKTPILRYTDIQRLAENLEKHGSEFISLHIGISSDRRMGVFSQTPVALLSSDGRCARGDGASAARDPCCAIRSLQSIERCQQVLHVSL